MRGSTIALNTNGRLVALLASSPGAEVPLVPRPACWRSACSASLARAAHGLDRFALRGLPMPQPLPLRAAREVRRLRVPAATAGLSAFVSLAVQFHCVGRGWDVLDDSAPEACDTIRKWLLAYCIVLTVLPFCQALAGPLLLGWGAVGLLLRANHRDCGDAAPSLYAFVDEMMVDAVTSCCLMALCLLFLWVVRRRAQRLSRDWATYGPVCTEVLRRIFAESVAIAGADPVECSICLEEVDVGARGDGAEGGLGQTWCTLRCGHTFHKPCLEEWLRRARLCPLCRVDLNTLYPQTSRTGDSPSLSTDTSS